MVLLTALLLLTGLLTRVLVLLARVLVWIAHVRISLVERSRDQRKAHPFGCKGTPVPPRSLRGKAVLAL